VSAPLAVRERAVAALGETAFATAFEAGQAMTFDEILAFRDEAVGQIRGGADPPV
jgi:hypothetical protein